MKTVGFIDYFLHEWHADHYPAWINQSSGGEYCVKYAWGAVDSPHPGGKSNRRWAEDMGISLCGSIEEVVEKSDALVVLSPDNAEQHECLSRLPLASGKPVYIDKTFAETLAAAKRIFQMAEQSSTPCYSTSALRYAEEYRQIPGGELSYIGSWGPNSLETYSIHQIEPIVALMGTQAQRVLYTGTEEVPSRLIEFTGGRRASITCFPCGSPFVMQMHGAGRTYLAEVKSDYFQAFIGHMVEFFRTGEIPVPHEQTLAVIAIREAGLQAAAAPGLWAGVPR